MWLPEEIPLGGHDQVSARAGVRVVGIAAHDGDGDACGLTHNELGGGGELVGGREHAGGEGEAVGVRLPTVVGEGPHPGDSYGDVGYAFPPRSAERVGDYDGEVGA